MQGNWEDTRYSPIYISLMLIKQNRNKYKVIMPEVKESRSYKDDHSSALLFQTSLTFFYIMTSSLLEKKRPSFMGQSDL